jgi:hypothetical protein
VWGTSVLGIASDIQVLEQPMSLRSKVLTVLLIAATAAGSWALAQGRFPSVKSGGRPSGCHEHSRNTPQTPTHDCCVTGHDVAILQVSQSLRPDAQFDQQALALFEPSSTLISAVLEYPAFHSATLSGAVSLRV